MTTNSLKVEYLVIIDTSNSFCSNLEACNNLLKSNSNISINGKQLKYKDLEVYYKVQTSELEETKERFFHLHFKCNRVSKILIFEELLRVIKDILYKVSNNEPQTLWDDISFHYSQKSYPLIYEIENLMRKLITKFMLTNVGLGWTKDNIPEEVKESVKGSEKEKKETPGYLYKVDFIQLRNFLFKEYSPVSPHKLLEKLKTTKTLSELTLEELKFYVPTSNWDKYFSEIVECERDYLSNRWDKLYKLRNKVAHNNNLIRRDYEEICKLVEDVKEKLQKAIASLDKIHVSEAEKDLVAENIVIDMGETYLRFMSNYRTLEALAIQCWEGLQNSPKEEKHRFSLNKVTKELHHEGIISSKLFEEINKISNIRNYVVHGSFPTKLAPDDIVVASNKTEQLIHLFIEEVKPVTKTMRAMPLEIKVVKEDGGENISPLKEKKLNDV